MCPLARPIFNLGARPGVPPLQDWSRGSYATVCPALFESWRVSAGGGDGVEAAVDVHHLAGRRREPVREESHARTGHRFGIAQVPAQRRPLGPDVLEAVEAGDATRGDGAQRAGADEVHADPVAAEVTRQIASGRLEGGL